MTERSESEPPLQPIDSDESTITGPDSYNTSSQLRNFDWWADWQATVGKDNLPDEPGEAEYLAWLKSKEVLFTVLKSEDIPYTGTPFDVD